MKPDSNLTDLLNALKEQVEGDEATIGDLISAVEDRGFGPLIILPALLAMLPTGAIPGVPTLMALVNSFICLQLLFGRRHPWLPHRLSQVTVSRDKIVHARDIALPWAGRIDQFLHPRFDLLTRKPAPRLVALLSLLLGLTMIPLELLPFAAAIPAASIVLLGLGLAARDGLLIIFSGGVAATGFSLLVALN